jgi:mannosyltransferase
MIAMGRKREDREKGKKLRVDRECNLDGEYKNPVRSFRDLTPENIKDALLSSRYLQLLLSLTLVGAILRFYNLGYNSLWLDEASTLTFAVKSMPEIWQATTGGEFNPPLFYWVEHLMLVFGNSEAVLRFIPALLGVLTIPLIYLAGKEFMDRNTGIIAAAAFAFSPFLIFYSQEARAYSMMLFFVTFAMVFYFRALKSDGLSDWALFGALSALAFWTHFYALVIIGALFLYALYELYPKIRNNLHAAKPLVAGGALFALICLPLIIVTIQLFAKRTGSAPTFGIQGPEIIIATFAQISGSGVAMYLLLILFIAGIVQAFLLDKNKGIFLVTVTVLMFVISNFLSYRMPMQPRYLICLAIVYFIAIALSYKLLFTLMENPGIVYALIAFMVVINAFSLAGYYSNYTKDDWRGFSSSFQEKTRPGDIVVVIPAYISQPFDYYYSNATDRTFEYTANNATDLQEINARKNNNTVFFVVTGDINAANPEGDAEQWLKQNAKILRQNTGIYLMSSG